MSEPYPVVVLECGVCEERLCSYSGLGWDDDLPVQAWQEHECKTLDEGGDGR